MENRANALHKGSIQTKYGSSLKNMLKICLKAHKKKAVRASLASVM